MENENTPEEVTVRFEYPSVKEQLAQAALGLGLTVVTGVAIFGIMGAAGHLMEKVQERREAKLEAKLRANPDLKVVK